MKTETGTILPTVPARVVSEIGLPQAHCQLLYNRSLSDRSTVQSFLSPGDSDAHDPWLMPDMDAAVSRLNEAIGRGESIGVFGDFDIDGISGTAVMSTALRDLGADVISYIPDRATEGHGLGLEAVQYLASRGVKLLVTVDCGSTSESVIGEASDLGVDTIVYRPPCPSGRASLPCRRHGESEAPRLDVPIRTPHGCGAQPTR